MSAIDTGPVVLPLPSPGWADLVFHVLAHAHETAPLAASVHDPAYVRFAERYLGPAGSRSLGADSEVLGRVLCSHQALARVGLLAWLFRELERATHVAALDLAELSSSAVDAPALLEPLRAQGPVVEVLRSACELERSSFERLPAASTDVARLRAALSAATRMAPALAGCTVSTVRSLRLRGRVRGSEIWVGMPAGDDPPSLEHVVLQACHEATVLEISRDLRVGDVLLDEREIEHAAVVLLALRAAAQGEAARHTRWLAHFGANAPATSEASLPAALRVLVRARAGLARGPA